VYPALQQFYLIDNVLDLVYVQTSVSVIPDCTHVVTDPGQPGVSLSLLAWRLAVVLDLQVLWSGRAGGGEELRVDLHLAQRQISAPVC